MACTVLPDTPLQGTSTEAVEVGEVTVEAERAPEEFHLDKKVINVSMRTMRIGKNKR